jgi:hypothetical protein
MASESGSQCRAGERQSGKSVSQPLTQAVQSKQSVYVPPGRSPPRSVSVHMPRLAASPAPRRRNAPLHAEQTRCPAPTSPHRLRLQDGEGEPLEGPRIAEAGNHHHTESYTSSQDFSLSFIKAKSGRRAQRGSAVINVLSAMWDRRLSAVREGHENKRLSRAGQSAKVLLTGSAQSRARLHRTSLSVSPRRKVAGARNGRDRQSSTGPKNRPTTWTTAAAVA